MSKQPRRSIGRRILGLVGRLRRKPRAIAEASMPTVLQRQELFMHHFESQGVKYKDFKPGEIIMYRVYHPKPEGSLYSRGKSGYPIVGLAFIPSKGKIRVTHESHYVPEPGSFTRFEKLPVKAVEHPERLTDTWIFNAKETTSLKQMDKKIQAKGYGGARIELLKIKPEFKRKRKST